MDLNFKFLVIFISLSMPSFRYFFIGSIILTIACTPPRQLELKGMELTSVQPGGSSLDSIIVRGKVRLLNPNSYALKVRRAEVKCKIRDESAGQMQLDSLFTLPASTESTIPVVLNIRTSALLAGGLDLILGKGIPYSVTGSARAGRGIFKWTFPFERSGTLGKNELKALGL